MDTCTFLLLCSLFNWMCPFAAGSCSSYTTINEPRRHATLPSVPPYLDDSGLVGTWVRFVGEGGDVLSFTCTGRLHGGGEDTMVTDHNYNKHGSGLFFAFASYYDGVCYLWNKHLDVLKCPGGFFIYRATSHPDHTVLPSKFSWTTAHSNCSIPNICGTKPHVYCGYAGICLCLPGYELASGSVPTVNNYDCVDVDECLGDVCGQYEICLNNVGSFACECATGFENVTGGTEPPCQDIDECLDTTICLPNLVCANEPGNYSCLCQEGFSTFNNIPPAVNNPCQDIDECASFPCANANCTNYDGGFSCVCLPGFTPTDGINPPASNNPCTDVNECLEDVCGQYEICLNNVGSFACECATGFENVTGGTEPPCQDIDECLDTTICLPNSVCANEPGDYSCLCQEGFSTFNNIPPAVNNPCQDVDECLEDVCGEYEICLNNVGSFACECATGFENVTGGTEPPCQDIDECLDTTICLPNSVCANEPGNYSCVCQEGFSTFNNIPPAVNNPCQDVDECLGDVCEEYEICLNNVGSFACECATGFENVTGGIEPPCQDIDECLDTTICLPNLVCANEPGDYSCICQEGFSTFNNIPPAVNNPCQDVDECVDDPDVCGPEATCNNTVGSYLCTCTPGYQPVTPAVIASYANPCSDIDECSETPDICGFLGVCTNVPGIFHCSCLEGSYPNTGVLWTMGVTYCRAIPDILDDIVPPEGQTAEMTFLRRVDLQLRDNLPKGLILSDMIVANCLSACMEVAGVGHRVDPVRVSSAGDGETGSLIQDITKLLMITLVPPDRNQTIIQVTTQTLDLTLYAFGPGIHKSNSTSLSANGNLMEINLKSLGKNNNDSAAVALMVLHDMESLLSDQYFETENRTEMMSDVITAELPKMNNTELTEPVNFTLMHINKLLPESGLVNCVYWNISTQQLMDLLHGGGDEDAEAYSSEWSEEGCWVSYTNENYTVCTCSHLSTFALILQTGEPPPQSDFLDWLNRICVIIGLFFFALAILTFLLCSWNPKINNTARLHLCLNLGLSHLLLLFNDVYVADKRACKAMAGLLHFVVVASFVWMLLEAVQLYILVRRLNKVQVIKRDGLPPLVLFLIGYGVPLVIVGVSASVYHPGYGATAAKICWLSQTHNFNWALTGPVIGILALNFLLFGATLWSLRTTLANMRSGASDSKDTKLVLFKIVAQFVILGCTWILGLYQTNLFFQILFIVLNSQQGTFLYIVHCVLNKEIREECLKCLTCSHKKKKEKTEEQSTTEQIDNTNGL